MTYERFSYVAFDGFEDNGEYITPYQVVEIMNELYEENKKLKKEIQGFIKGIQDSSRMSAEAVVKGYGKEYDYE